MQNKTGLTQNDRQQTRYFTPLYEVVDEDGIQNRIHYLSAPTGIFAIFTIENGNNGRMKYVLKDHQGSLAALVNEKSGTEYFSFDACSVKLGFCECSETKALVEQIPTEARSREGNRRNAQTWAYTNMPISFGTTRGFTMHEHLDEFKLINMNGRVYDPLVGRFISPDPFVQLPDYSQSYNRYSYAFNNPLRFSDPSGFFAEGDSTLNPAQIPPPMPYLPGTKLNRSSTSTNTDNTSFGLVFKETETTLPIPYPQSKLSNDAEGNVESQTGRGEGLSTNFVAGTSWAGFVAGAKKGYNIISNEVIRQGNYNNSIRKSGISLDDVTSLKVPNSLKIVGKYGGLIFTFYGAYNIDQQWRNSEISTGIMMIEQISNGIGAIPAYGTGWSIGWNLGKSYGPSTWYGKNNYKWFE